MTSLLKDIEDSDPFTVAYDAIWDLLESEKAVTDLVLLGNRWKYTDASLDPGKHNIQTADLPELALAPVSGGTTTFTSSSVSVTTNLILRGVSGDLRVDQVFFPLKWAVVKALAKFRADTPFEFINNIWITDFSDAIDGLEEHRGIRGWAMRVGITVEMWFNMDELRI